MVTQAQLLAVIDKQEISDCLHRYTRGLDRFDRELLLSAYHPDAIDDHGVFTGSPGEFAEWMISWLDEHQFSNSHMLTNITTELDGDVAHVESYWFSAAVAKPDSALSLMGGRYLDRLERRGGHWAIAARKCVVDWHGTPGPLPVPAEAVPSLNFAGLPARSRADPSYDRPLKVDPARLVQKAGDRHFGGRK